MTKHFERRADIPTPTNTIIIEDVKADKNAPDHYAAQEEAVNRVFKDYPKNDDLVEILIKVCVLNDFYSTNILSAFKMAQHIFDLKIDSRLAAKDLTVVNDIALLNVDNGKTRNFYSFATKYCCHQNQDVYPIYDSYVARLLTYYAQVDKFDAFKPQDLRNYPRYCEVLRNFRNHYALDSEKIATRDLDAYLWRLGKRVFR